MVAVQGNQGPETRPRKQHDQRKPPTWPAEEHEQRAAFRDRLGQGRESDEERRAGLRMLDRHVQTAAGPARLRDEAHAAAAAARSGVVALTSALGLLHAADLYACTTRDRGALAQLRDDLAKLIERWAAVELRASVRMYRADIECRNLAERQIAERDAWVPPSRGGGR